MLDEIDETVHVLAAEHAITRAALGALDAGAGAAGPEGSRGLAHAFVEVIGQQAGRHSRRSALGGDLRLRRHLSRPPGVFGAIRN